MYILFTIPYAYSWSSEAFNDVNCLPKFVCQIFNFNQAYIDRLRTDFASLKTSLSAFQSLTQLSKIQHCLYSFCRYIRHLECSTPILQTSISPPTLPKTTQSKRQTQNSTSISRNCDSARSLANHLTSVSSVKSVIKQNLFKPSPKHNF